jgi:hypothetical protein
LIQHAWPGERFNAEVHGNRLHVALSTLRGLGLRELLERTAHGYRIRPSTVLADRKNNRVHGFCRHWPGIGAWG